MFSDPAVGADGSDDQFLLQSVTLCDNIVLDYVTHMIYIVCNVTVTA